MGAAIGSLQSLPNKIWRFYEVVFYDVSLHLESCLMLVTLSPHHAGGLQGCHLRQAGLHLLVAGVVWSTHEWGPELLPPNPL